MKSEESSTSTTNQPAAQQPAQTYTTQWASGAMAIDPALQQQTAQHPTASSYYQAYTSHYPQAAYATHYQAYAPPAPQPVAAQQQQQQAQQPLARQPVAQQQYQASTYSLNTATPANANTSSGGMDTADIATLNDALGSAGVDLRAEEESLQRTHDSHQSYRAYEDRTRKQPPKPAFDTRILGTTMRTIGTQHKVTRVPEESINYLALALRARLQDLITAMIAASHHRTDTQFDRPASLYEDSSPMWSIVVRSDVAKQLAALEKVEREEEMRIRKERKERADMTAAHTAALAAQANGMAAAQAAESTEEAEGNVKKKRKKDGPGVTARNMSEDVRKKMSNAVATQAAGLGGKYSWMNAANAATPAPKPKVATPTATTAAATAAATSPAGTTGASAASATTTVPAGAGSSWARPYVPTKKSASATPKEMLAEDDTRTSVTMRDAMFVVEKERGHGGGRGAARGWV
ncbi:transcription initiation factor TFIID component TAF4 family-domain-containing protein [Flammula alnicola]|nr:transcription initiation factor TFIID component TAF4 family-domain-containing protein [Flammula alnicola]